MDIDKRVAEWAGGKFCPDSNGRIWLSGGKVISATEWLLSDEGSMAIMRALAREGLTIDIRYSDPTAPTEFVIFLEWCSDEGTLIDASAPTLNAAILEAAREYVKEK